MYAHTFATLLKGWLNSADHPGITQVRTCADIGRWEQPVGVAVTLSDGWLFVLQTVGAAPYPGGDRNRDPDSVPPRVVGDWKDLPTYRTNRKAFEAAQGAYSGLRGKRPQAKVRDLLAVVLDVVKRADHEKITQVEVPEDRPVLIVTCGDGAKVYGLPAGYLAPGATDLAHPAHHISDDWT